MLKEMDGTDHIGKPGRNSLLQSPLQASS